jgi:bacillithiol system protein YtxJ
MNWIVLNRPEQLEALRAESKNQPVIIFKHSTRCSISQAALGRLERNWKDDDMVTVKPYFLDLLSFRDISNKIADLFHIEHQSPQVIILKDGEVVFHKSHFEIDFSTIKKAAQWVESSKN